MAVWKEETSAEHKLWMLRLQGVHRERRVAEVQEFLQVVIVAVRLRSALHGAERQQVLQLVASRQLQCQRRLRERGRSSAAGIKQVKQTLRMSSS